MNECPPVANELDVNVPEPPTTFAVPNVVVTAETVSRKVKVPGTDGDTDAVSVTGAPAAAEVTGLAVNVVVVGAGDPAGSVDCHAVGLVNQIDVVKAP